MLVSCEWIWDSVWEQMRAHMTQTQFTDYILHSASEYDICNIPSEFQLQCQRSSLVLPGFSHQTGPEREKQNNHEFLFTKIRNYNKLKDICVYTEM